MTAALFVAAIVSFGFTVLATMRLIDGRWSRDWPALVSITGFLVAASAFFGLAAERLGG